MRSLSYEKRNELYANKATGVEVYTAEVLNENREVVIKKTRHFSMEEANLAIGEAMTQSKLDHPHICQIYDCFIEKQGEDNFVSSLVLEKLGCDLSSEISRRKSENRPWTESELLAFLRQLTSALCYAQRRGVAHQDIKPQNIFLCGESHIKLGDFGSARNFSAISRCTGLQGSPFFLSPELKTIFLEELVNPCGKEVRIDRYKSDVYSLGVSVLYMARLEMPVELVNLEQLQDTTERTIGAVAGKSLRKLLTEMLKIDPQQRISLQELEQLLGEPAHPDQEPKQCRPKVCFICSVQFQPSFPWQETEDGVCICSYPCKLRKETQSCSICISCESPIVNHDWWSEANSEFPMYAENFPYFCELSCFCAYYKQTKEVVKCVWCKCEMREEDKRLIIPLTCLHVFHDCLCAGNYLLHCSNPSLEAAAFFCPVCKVPIDSEVVSTVRATYLALDERADVECSLCGTPQKWMVYECGHRSCKACVRHKYDLYFFTLGKEVCPVCDSSDELQYSQH